MIAWISREVRAGALGILLLASLSALAEPPRHLNAEGYRAAYYRAPTPANVPNGTTLTTAELRQLLATQSPVLVDVQAIAMRPELLDFAIDWLPDVPRQSLPGSVWLPNVGYASLSPTLDAYFREQLARLTAGDRARAIVIFCVADCWMSWNAVQRAHGYGYRNLYWYPDGTDGWREARLPLTEVQPVPLDREVTR
ncbi:MAG: rhodanese-like domain-containing protein [Thiotrichales bacterium]